MTYARFYMMSIKNATTKTKRNKEEIYRGILQYNEGILKFIFSHLYIINLFQPKIT